jgi:hypothetical protein
MEVRGATAAATLAVVFRVGPDDLPASDEGGVGKEYSGDAAENEEVVY